MVSQMPEEEGWSQNSWIRADTRPPQAPAEATGRK